MRETVPAHVKALIQRAELPSPTGDVSAAMIENSNEESRRAEIRALIIAIPRKGFAKNKTFCWIPRARVIETVSVTKRLSIE